MSSSPLRPTPRNQFSFSRLRTFHQCPRRYEYRYLQGIPEAFRSVEAHVGTTVHTVLEWLYTVRDDLGPPPLAEALDHLECSWHESLTDDIVVIRADETLDDALLLARGMVERFVTDTFQRDGSETVALEHRVNHPLSPGIVFTGFADRVGRTANGRLFVVDYKTSKSVGDPSDFSEGLQAPLYAACLLAEGGADGDALAGYHYLRHGTTNWHCVTREGAEALLARFAGMAEAALRATEFPARPSVLCAWCGYCAICPDADVPERFSGGLARAEAARESLG
jgi:putative RecB family exonuclease